MDLIDLGSFFRRDDKSILQFDDLVYKKFYPIIDIQTFEIIESNGSTHHYFKDKNKVYIDSYMCKFTVLENADPNNFSIIDFEKGFTSSGENQYYFDVKLPYDINRAEILNEHYIKSNNKIYAGYTREVLGADLESFVIPHPDLISNLAKDKNFVYFREKVVPYANPATFAFLEECINSDIYYLECDNTFYAKDDKFAYFVRTIANNVKMIKTKSLGHFSFKVIDNLSYAFDKEYQYFLVNALK